MEISSILTKDSETTQTTTSEPQVQIQTETPAQPPNTMTQFLEAAQSSNLNMGAQIQLPRTSADVARAIATSDPVGLASSIPPASPLGECLLHVTLHPSPNAKRLLEQIRKAHAEGRVNHIARN